MDQSSKIQGYDDLEIGAWVGRGFGFTQTMLMSFRGFILAAVAIHFFANAARAQLAITSGPNYCCWSIGQVQQALTASGGNGTYTWSLVAGSLPHGLSIRTDALSSLPAGASAGLIGVATTAGTYNFTLQADVATATWVDKSGPNSINSRDFRLA